MTKLMLVEDDNNLREIYEARLQAEGYLIVSAKDGEEALAIAKAEKPDLIISDVMMPKISGFEMLDIIRNTEELKNVKVIMLTALGQSDDQQRADRLGADRYLVKSQVTLEDIVKVTHQLLGDEQASTSSTTPVVTPPATVNPSAASQPPTGNGSTTPSLLVSPSSPPTEPIASLLGQEEEAAKNTQSTAHEEADVEAQIEDFVSGATQEATPPVAKKTSTETTPATEDFSAGATQEENPPAATPPDASNPTPVSTSKDDTAATDVVDEATVLQPEPTPSSTEPTSNIDAAASSSVDEKLLADAAQKLADSNINSPVITPASNISENENPEATKTATTPDIASPGSVPIAHKKVIEPIVGEPKKDLNTLLAIDAAKQTLTKAPPPPTAIIATNETGATSVPLAEAPVIEPPKEPSNTIAPTAEPSPTTPTVTPLNGPQLANDGEPINPNSIAL